MIWWVRPLLLWSAGCMLLLPPGGVCLVADQWLLAATAAPDDGRQAVDLPAPHSKTAAALSAAKRWTPASSCCRQPHLASRSGTGQTSHRLEQGHAQHARTAAAVCPLHAAEPGQTAPAPATDCCCRPLPAVLDSVLRLADHQPAWSLELAVPAQVVPDLPCQAHAALDWFDQARPRADRPLQILLGVWRC